MSAAPLDREELLTKVTQLPALPAVVGEILNALDDDDLPTQRLVSRINADPVLVARVLSAANASCMGVSHPVTSLSEAFTLLGIKRVRKLVLIAALIRQVPPNVPEFDPQAFWRHSFAVAVCARAIAAHAGANQEEAFNAGLLHDIGYLLMVSVYPERFVDIFNSIRCHDLGMVDAEEAVFGTNHAEIGCLMAEHWKLPFAFQEAIANHHNPDGTGGIGASIVHLAEVLAHALDMGTVQMSHVPAMSVQACATLGIRWKDFASRFADIEARYEAARGEFGM